MFELRESKMQNLALEFVLVFVLFNICHAQNETCGYAAPTAAFQYNATASMIGAWPWLATIHKANTDQYFCGGVFLGSNLVLTVSCDDIKFIYDRNV